MSFSVRELLVAFVVAAIALTVMQSRSIVVASVFVYCGWLLVIACAIVALLGGRSRPFCIGFVTSAVVLHFTAARENADKYWQGPDESVESPTNHILTVLYTTAYSEEPRVADYSPFGPPVAPEPWGQIAFFRPGQMAMFLLTCYISGKFASFIYRRNRQSRASPSDESHARDAADGAGR